MKITDKRRDAFMAKVSKKPSGCWLWTGIEHRKHGMFYAGGKMDQAHRISWRLRNGEIPEGLWVLHNCRNSMCVNPAHLRLGTRADNVADAVKRGEMASGDRNPMRLYPELRPRGASHGLAKLDDAKVAAMRVLYSGGLAHRKIAVKFGVSGHTALHAIRGKTWSHVPFAIVATRRVKR